MPAARISLLLPAAVAAAMAGPAAGQELTFWSLAFANEDSEVMASAFEATQPGIDIVAEGSLDPAEAGAEMQRFNDKNAG